MVTVQWQSGKKVVIGSPNFAVEEVVYPIPG